MSTRPKTCQMVPTTFHGISSGSAIRTRQTENAEAACLGMLSAMHDAERDLDGEDDRSEKIRLRAERVLQNRS